MKKSARVEPDPGQIKKAASLAIEQVPLSDLLPSPYNPRRMTDEAFARLKRGIAEFGLVDPIIARRADRLVIGGHQRLRAAQDLGLETVPVVYLDEISDERAAALNVLLNNPRAQGEWDLPKLSELLAGLDTAGFDATFTGFDEAEVAELLRPVTMAEVDAEPAGKPPDSRDNECPRCGYRW